MRGSLLDGYGLRSFSFNPFDTLLDVVLENYLPTQSYLFSREQCS